MTDPAGAPEGGDADSLIRGLKERGRMIDPAKHTHPIRVIPKGALKEMVLDLLRRHGGAPSAELLQKIAMLEMELAKAREELAQAREKAGEEAKLKILELEKQVQIEQGHAADLEARLAAAQAEIDRLAAELAVLQKSLSADAKSRVELEKLVLELQARILELELALDYFDLEEEPDPGLVRGAIEDASNRAAGRSPALKERLSEISRRAQVAQESFRLLREKMDEGKAGVGVVVDLVKCLKDGASAEQQARRISEALG